MRWSRSSDEEVEANIASIQHEQAIYRRLGRYNGIVPCLCFSDTSTELRIMENGDLQSYLYRNKPPKSLQLSWFRTMARTLAYIHAQKVIVADIASRNFVLDSDLSIKMCDFTEAIDMPLDTCMENAGFGGYSVQTDIGQLGAVMYEVVVGEKCEFDIFEGVPVEASRGVWPRREELPSTEGLWVGLIIERCWTEGAFCTAYDLRRALEAVEVDDEPVYTKA
ncbi:TKL protein kinase [Aspergillus sclerotioniger CBS 115572]|uniref:TKL protein kinase n=1 Tax=Aspergillus sclerotioniger CBS 115572 TaxID=1450535 RepID=A0A317WBG0_9EURO|nr:TKL protein kinase [Aspergillus sclerotioniger CBS 115572]PWY83764.1 TKL protein kinase [Aspergillus sclerotioniger CBS 115572]